MDVILKGHNGYNEAKKIFNLIKESNPSSIFYCKNATDVSSLIKLCSDKQIPFRVRSGGHNHEGLCSANEYFVIDISGIKDFELINHNDEQCVWVGAGLKNKEITDNLNQHNLIINGGACESVGISGLILGGGWNLYTREKGLACDSVVAMKVVLANGDIEVISPDNKKDLFEAMLGSGGGNFAIATHFLIKTFMRDSFYSFEYEKIADLECIKQNMKSWIDYQNLEGNEISSFFRIFGLPDEKYGFRIAGHVFADKADNAKELVESKLNIELEKDPIPKPLLKLNLKKSNSFRSNSSLENGINSPIYMMENRRLSIDTDYKDLIDAKKSVYSCSKAMSHKVTSAFPKDNKYDDELVNSILQYLKEAEEDIKTFDDKHCYCIISLHALGGKVKDSSSSTFSYRDKNYTIQMQSWWDFECTISERCKKWLMDFRSNLISKNLVEGAFVNFIDLDILSDDLNPYYRSDVSEKLKEIKEKYDPKGIFQSGLRFTQK